MADVIGLDNAAIARIERAEKDIKATSGSLTLSNAGQIAGQIDAAVKKILENVDAVGKFAGLDTEQTRDLRQGLEAVEGGFRAAHKAIPYALALRGPAGLALLAGATALGVVGGATRETARRFSAASAIADADADYAATRGQDEAVKRFREAEAARKRARSIR